MFENLGWRIKKLIKSYGVGKGSCEVVNGRKVLWRRI